MLSFSGYTVGQELYRSATSIVYRAVRLSDETPVILKVLNQSDPAPEHLARLHHEYELIRDLSLPGVVAAYSLEYSPPYWFLVLEDFGGVALADLEHSGVLPLNKTLEIALQVADCLGQIHRRRIIHKDITPANLIVHPVSGKIKLIDFGIAAAPAHASLPFHNPNVLEGTLAYIAPEQTARTSRPVDYRADFYSLGVTLYELLTGRLPFAKTDALDLVHSHLAKTPVSPHAIDATIPPVVSDIVLKLMAKNAEDRYQSAFGLKADLLECLRQLEANGSIALFPPARHDVPDRFQIAQTLYGRECETEMLLAAFARACHGAGELLQVTGAAGIGKSALVQTLYTPIAAHGGIFLAGKFDQLQRNIPYSAIIQAFRSLGSQLLAGSTAEIGVWRERLCAACGANLGVITDVVPEIGLIVGPQPAVPTLGAIEAQHRFNLVFQQFITVFTRPDHPLILFLDDLQWADGASLQLIEQLVNVAAGRHLLVILAYRDSEVGAGHSLYLLLDALRHGATPISMISLESLGAPAVTRLVSETLHCANARAWPLAELVVAKTGGNPFFVNEFLLALHAEGRISFDYERGGWQWDLEQIAASASTENVIDLLALRVSRLGGQTRQLLELAACLGCEFDLPALAVAADLPADTIRHNLAPAVADGLIMASTAPPQSYALGRPGNERAEATGYRFAHDRVQQAIYELIQTEERPAAHWRIGERLWRGADPAEIEAWLFMLVNQLGLGRSCIPDRLTAQAVAELHLLAGRRAAASAAYEPAWRYLRAGTALLDNSAWGERYSLAHDLYSEAAQAAYLAGDFAAMEQLAAVVVERAATPLEIVEVYEARIQAYAVQNHMREAVRTALDILRRLGFTLAERPEPAERRRAIAEIHTVLAGRPIAALSALPPMTDPTTRAAMRIMAGATSAAYNGMPGLFILLVARQVTLSISHGIAPESAYAFAIYGLFLCNAADITTGAQFGRLALDLASLPEARRHRAKTRQVVHTFISHWQEPLRSVLPLLREDYHLGIETGDVEYAAYALDVQGYGGFTAGVDLERLARELELSRDAIAAIRQTTALNYLEIFRQAVQNLRGESAEPWRLAGPIYAEEHMVPMHHAANDHPALFFANVVMLMLAYLWRQYDRALACADQARAYIDGASGSLTLPLFYLYDSLARLALAEEQQGAKGASSPVAARPASRALIQTVRTNQRRLRQWAEHAPMNQLQRWHLVEAEQARIQKKYGAAREHYDQAIALAREHSYHADEALACELAGAFYVMRGHTRLAQLYLGDARDAWSGWGALAKARDLTEHYPQLFAQRSGRGAHVLDVTSVFRASHAISSEIVLDRLLTTIMQIVIENAGAQRGYLLRGQPGQWVVEAEGGPEAGITLGQGRPVSADELPLSILNYVAHSRRYSVIDDIERDRQFAGDSYVIKRRPRSVLCAPLMRQGTIVGLLYLENNLTSGVFTPERVEIVSLLAGQVAISIENAGLYSHLEELVAARTGELSAAYDSLKALNDRLQAELQLARHIQQHLLLPARPSWAELDVVCSSTPAREVGGDFYLYHAFKGADLREHAGRYVLVVGDVSGKGMPAALVMAISLGLSQSVVGQGMPPAALLAQLDQALAPYTRATRQNCALVYVEISRQPEQSAAGDTVLLRVANAGGVTPLIKRSDGAVEWVEIGGLPLGIELAAKPGYQEAVICLGPEDMVVLVSDGVIEASNAGGELFGFERFEQTIQSGPRQSAEAMLHHLQSAVSLFGSDAEPHDDMTMIVVRPFK